MSSGVKGQSKKPKRPDPKVCQIKVIDRLKETKRKLTDIVYYLITVS